MPGSTSNHNLTADFGLSLKDKVKWLGLNIINNLNPNGNLDPSLNIKAFKPDNLEFKYRHFNGIVSPARYLCNLFWQEFAEKYELELGGKIKAVEVGCGDGVYGKLLDEILNNRITYRGLDLFKNEKWHDFGRDDRFSFYQADSVDLSNHLHNTNFIFTQSALEHFTEDLTFFEQVAQYANTSKKHLIQVHLLPSFSCIKTFPWHGVRQYTPRTISKITNLFADSSEINLYKLGSVNCNKLHRKWITYPKILRKKDKRFSDSLIYKENLINAIKKDINNDSIEACFYALEIKNIFKS